MSISSAEARSDAPPRTLWDQGILAASLALVAGYVDAYSYLSYKVYASFMSGNTTQSGLADRRGRVFDGGAAHPADCGVCFGRLRRHVAAARANVATGTLAVRGVRGAVVGQSGRDAGGRLATVVQRYVAGNGDGRDEYDSHSCRQTVGGFRVCFRYSQQRGATLGIGGQARAGAARPRRVGHKLAARRFAGERMVRLFIWCPERRGGQRTLRLVGAVAADCLSARAGGLRPQQKHFGLIQQANARLNMEKPYLSKKYLMLNSEPDALVGFDARIARKEYIMLNSEQRKATADQLATASKTRLKNMTGRLSAGDPKKAEQAMWLQLDMN